MVDPRDVSVVVQGPVIGNESHCPRLQLTRRCLESVRRHLPEAELILSTWRGASVSGLPHDVLVINDDPGGVPMDVKRRLMNNVNRQIVSTLGGLRQASRPYAVKLRSDMDLGGPDFLNWFGRYNRRASEFRVFEERIVGCTLYTINPRRFAPLAFHPSDWFHFGLRADLLKLWDVPLALEPETSRWFEHRSREQHVGIGHFTWRFAAEQIIWLGCLRKHSGVEVDIDHLVDVRGDTIRNSELSIANNFVLLPPRRLRVAYLKRGRGGLRDHLRLATYTHGEWLRLYQRYCDESLSPPLLDVRSLFKNGVDRVYKCGRWISRRVRNQRTANMKGTL
jgi:hypothetical protein